MNQPDFGDTEPINRIDDSAQGLPWLWLIGLLGMLLLAGALFTLVLALINIDTNDTQTLSVTLIVDGLVYTTTTDAQTVGELLDVEDIERSDDTTLSASEDTLLTDGMTVTIDQQRMVKLTVDGLNSFFRTVMDNPKDILDNAGVELSAGDEVTVNGVPVDHDELATFPLPANEITVQRGVTITLQRDEENEAESITTTAQTVGDVLGELGVALYLGDLVEPDLDTELSEGLAITIERSQPITITADDTTIQTRTRGETVADALSEAGITLSGQDYAVPSTNAPLRADMQIRIVRVTEEVITEQITVPYEVVYQADPERELDTQAVAQLGENGTDQRSIRITYENGVEVSRFDEGLTRIKDPVNQVISYGTKIVLRTIDTPEGPREYWRKLTVYATSYHPAALGGDNITSIGETLTKGIIGIDPKLIPYRTMMYVPGYGIGMAADTGGPRSTRYWIDLGYDDDNYVGWHRNVEIYLLTPVPENFPLILP